MAAALFVPHNQDSGSREIPGMLGPGKKRFAMNGLGGKRGREGLTCRGMNLSGETVRQ
jgi:hypothetical protein